MILIIDNYDSFTYNLYQSIARVRDNIEVVRNDAITVDEVAGLKPSGIVLSPGPGRPDNAGICVALIQALHTTVPILGVCLGHQSIIQAFGGVIKQHDDIVHGKPTQIFHHRKGVFADLNLPFQAARYHSLVGEKETLPEALEITAENETGVLMAVQHKTYPVFGVQFHPESFLTESGDGLIENFVGVCHHE